MPEDALLPPRQQERQLVSRTRHASKANPGAASRFAAKIPSGLPQVGALESLPDPVVTLARDYPDGHLIDWHHHRRAQLIYASSGVMRVATAAGVWVVPPLRAVWVPPAVEHEIRMPTPVQMRTLYVDPRRCGALPPHCCVVEVSPLLRELILRMVDSTSAARLPGIEHMAELALLEIREVSTLPLRIPMPTDSRALKVCEGLLEEPSDGRTCKEWGDRVGASTRTLERLFARETQMSFSVWRTQARLLEAVSRLAAGAPVISVAHELGYDSPSAFTAMFKRTLSVSPSEYFRV